MPKKWTDAVDASIRVVNRKTGKVDISKGAAIQANTTHHRIMSKVDEEIGDYPRRKPGDDLLPTGKKMADDISVARGIRQYNKALDIKKKRKHDASGP